MVVLFVNENDFCYYRNCLYNHRYKFSSEKEQVNESQYIVSRPDSVRICHSNRIGNRGVISSVSEPGFHGHFRPHTHQSMHEHIIAQLTTQLSRGQSRAAPFGFQNL